MSRVTLSPKLEVVTVYNDSAQLTFSAQVPLEPSAAITAVVENMEQWGSVDWGTLQLRLDPETDAGVAAGVMLQNINPIHDTVQVDVRADVQKVKEEIEHIEEERDVCAEELDILNESCEHIKEIRQYVNSAGFSVPAQQGGNAECQAYLQGYLQDPSKWAAMAAFFASRTAAAQREIATLNVKREKIEERLNAAHQRLMELGGDSGVQWRATNAVEATLVVGDAIPSGTKLTLEMSCVVSGAGWSSLYDLRVDYAESKIDVFYFANVRQCTSVDWEKVRLRLSTATPHTGGSPPPLWPRWEISTKPPVSIQPHMHKRRLGGPMRMMKAQVRGGGFGGAPGAAYSAPVAPMLESADVSGGGGGSSAMVYAIPGLATVRHNNVDVKVTVAHERFPVKLQFVSIPKLEPLTHLSATAVNSTDYELIAGPSKVFYGNTFVNNSQLGNVSPGEEFQVSLGADETVKVSRSLVRRAEADKSTFFSSHKTELRFHYAFAVECGAVSSKGPVTVVVKDNFPVSDDSDVVVSLVEPVPASADTPSSVKDATVTVDEDTHEIAWTFPMQKHEKKNFDLVFTAKYPEKTDVFGLE